MFSLGFGEILIICVILIIVVGPERLPTVMKNVGKTMRTVREASREIRTTVGLDELMRDDPMRPTLPKRIPPVATVARPAQSAPGTAAEGTPAPASAAQAAPPSAAPQAAPLPVEPATPPASLDPTSGASDAPQAAAAVPHSVPHSVPVAAAAPAAPPHVKAKE